ncbi:MAG: hypothetical protein RL033_5207 [Pseudomonadota bacterium]|jgi:hypothetical protein
MAPTVRSFLPLDHFRSCFSTQPVFPGTVHAAAMPAAAKHPQPLSSLLPSAVAPGISDATAPWHCPPTVRLHSRAAFGNTCAHLPRTTPARSSSPSRSFASRFRGPRSLSDALVPDVEHGHACSCRVTALHVLSFSRAMGHAAQNVSAWFWALPGSPAMALFRRFVAAGPSGGGREWLVLGRVVNASLAV